jgi:serine/threonine protein kinase
MGKPKQTPIADLIADTREQIALTPGLRGPQQDAIPGYKILREIHRGGQGVVYLAHQLATQRDVAIKMMREGPFAGSGERARFEREAHILASIKHPNIVTIHDSGNAAGNHFFVMDYIPGLPLDAWADDLRGGDESSFRGLAARNKTSRLIETLTKICDAVAIAHQRGVIHRDLKPNNIRIDAEDEPYVLDFGLAKSIGNDVEGDTRGGHSITATGQFLGTLPWSSPEQVSTASHVADVRSDVYALGLMIYRALTGQMPYRIDAALSDMVQVITQQEPVRPRVYASYLERDLETLTLKCLHKDPDRRYQSAGELAADLRRYANCEPVRARPDSSLYSLRMFARRHRALVVGTVAFVSMLAASSAALSWLYMKARQNEQLAHRRAQETEQVADFQNAQLAQIDPEAMGVFLREQLLAGVREAATTVDQEAEWNAAADPNSSLSAGVPGNAHVTTASPSAESFAGANFTNVAMKILEEKIFATAISAAEEQFADQPKLQAQFLQSTAETMAHLSLFDRALPAQRRALSMWTESLGADHANTLDAQVDLAYLLLAKGQHEEAESTILHAADRLTKILGDDHPATLGAITIKGAVLRERGFYDESLACLQAALAGFREVLGEEAAETLEVTGQVGEILQTMERFDEAMDHHQLALDGQQALWGANDPRTTATLNNIAALHSQTGNFEEAIGRYRELVTLLESQWGDEHQKTLAARANLAKALGSNGQVLPAIVLYDKVLKTRQRVLGALHMDTLNTLSGFASELAKTGQKDRALGMQSEAVSGFRATLGNQHPHTIRAINGLALAHQYTGDEEEAIRLFEEAIAGNRRLLGDDNSETLLAIGNLGVLLHSRKQIEQAEVLLKEAAEGMQRVLGPKHRHTNTFLRRYVRLLRDQKRYDEALPIAQEALEAALEIYGDDRLDPQNAKMLVGSIYKAKQEYETALAYYEDSTAGYRRIAGARHPYTLSSIRFLGLLLETMGQTELALELFEESYKGRREVLGEQVTDTLASAGNVGLVYSLQGRLQEAVPLLSKVADGLDGDEEYRDVRLRVLKELVRLSTEDALEQDDLADLPSESELRKQLNAMQEAAKERYSDEVNNTD